MNEGGGRYMKAVKGGRQLLTEGRQLEQTGKWQEAAAIYEQWLHGEPANEEAVGRLLVVYRKLKEYRKELAVIEAALATIARRNKTAQENWISAHPGAAKLGREVLQKLGDERVTAYGTDPVAEKLLKRKEFVEKKIGGGKTTRTAKNKKAKGGGPKTKKAVVAEGRRKERAQRELVIKKRRMEAEERKGQERENKAAAKARQAEKEVKIRPSLFVVSLRYLAPLGRIDSAMGKHVAFLDRYFASGDFLVSGRQVPRTGGIIIARGKDRAVVERIMKQDPFVREGKTCECRYCRVCG